MGMSIDEALEYLTDFSIYSPYQEAIDKVSAYIEQMQSDYENRLKADMVAMLTELKTEISIMSDSVVEGRTVTITSWNGMQKRICDIIQQKINSLKAESEPQAEKEQTDD